jgi:ribonuclease HII
MTEQAFISAQRIAGVDEAGRGPLAGPVVAAAVIFPTDYSNKKIQDSKKLSAKKRDLLFEEIKADALEWAIVSVGHHRIEKHNILGASLLAMSYALKRTSADFVLVDGNKEIPTSVRQLTVIGGDAIHIQISAASILAKVWRDRLMQRLDIQYPGYGFAVHAGYPTKVHREVIADRGPSAVHRRSFRGVAEYWHNANS